MSPRKPGRNDPCPCGSGKKYKHCCMRQDRQRRRGRASSPLAHLGEGQTSSIQEQLAQIRSLGQAVMDQVPSEQAQELQRLLEQAEELAAYEALRDEIETATQALEAHRAEFEALMKDGIAAMDRTQRLFSEEPFVPMRYAAADVHRAFEAVGYPSLYRKEPTEEDMETLVAAVLHLADEDQRFHLARQLMMTLPAYVAAERYLDAWLIQYSAFQMTEALNESNPFLFTMFNLAFAEWASEVDSQQEALMHELGMDRSAITGMSVDEVEAWLEAQMTDPAKRAQVEAYYAAHPLMSDQAEAEIIELERGALSLLERDDADPLYLSPEELEPWIPVLLERLEPMKAQARQVAERGDWDDPDTLRAMGDTFVKVAREMVPVVFTPERLNRLVAELRDYWRRLLNEGESQAAMHAHAAFMMLGREETPAENPLLIAICFDSLRLLLITLSEEARARAEGTETEEVES